MNATLEGEGTEEGEKSTEYDKLQVEEKTREQTPEIFNNEYAIKITFP